MKKATRSAEQFTCAALTVQNVAELLNISLSTAYSLVEDAYRNPQHADFKVLRLGKTFRIIKKPFFEYLGIQDGE